MLPFYLLLLTDLVTILSMSDGVMNFMLELCSLDAMVAIIVDDQNWQQTDQAGPTGLIGAPRRSDRSECCSRYSRS